jgi:heavy metal sensor kinase
MLRVLTLHEPVGDALGALRWIIVISLPCVVALLALGGYIITRRWISPLEKMVADATHITAKALDRRLSVADPDDELGQLATVFNATLDRLERSFTTLERFVADASHELRTPLTTLRSVGEVGLRRGRTVEEYREIIGSMLEESQRLQVLIQRLLELATAEGGTTRIERSPVKLEELVAATVGEVAVLAEHKSQQLHLQLEPLTLATDSILLRQALLNLLENAIKYNPEGARVLVSTERRGGSVRITVADEGPGITLADQERLTDRFFRAERGRAGDPGGVGLGLAITKAYLRLLGGELEYEGVAPRGSRFHLTLTL